MRKLAILLLSSMVFCFYGGKLHAQKFANNITTSFTCKSVSVLTKKYDISNVVLLFTDSTKQKFDNQKGNAGAYAGTGEYFGKIIAGVWVKAGNNLSGDCPGCGEFFRQTQTNCTSNTGGNPGANPIDLCVTGDAAATNIVYKVDGQIVTSLQGVVREGSEVEVTFTTAAGTQPTRFSLVSYNAASATFSEKSAEQNDVYDYESAEFGPGTHTISVTVPNNYFEVDFVKGCVIWKFGPEGTNNYYTKQSRLYGTATGGSKNSCKNCDNDKKVTICHVPKGNPENAHTITISKNAAKAHIGRHGGDYYGECKPLSGGGEEPKSNVVVNCTSTTVTGNVKIETITFLFDNYTTQTLQINSKTASVKPTGPFEAFFVRGVYVQFEGGTTVTTVRGQTVKGTYYANTCYNINTGTASTSTTPGSADCMAGDAQAQNIIYKVNGKIVPTLAGNVKEGNYVEVTFTTAAGTQPTRFSLVAYNAMDANYSEHNAMQNDVFDYESDMFTAGTHTIGVTVPNNYFQVDFVKGCVIWKFGPETSNNYYEKQGRSMGRANGGTKTPCTKCEENKKVTICHIPKGNPANAHTITVSQNAAKAHIGRHGGDYYGECKNVPPTTGGEISAEFTCTSVKVTSENQVLAYLVLLFSDSTREKFDNIAGLTGIFSGTGANTGKTVIGVWVKASNNILADCSGCGTFFKSNADCGGENGTAEVSITCSTATVSADVNIESITLLLDDSSTQTFVINAKTASVSPNNEYEGYFIRGAFIQLAGGTTVTTINGTEVQGNFYANETFEECEEPINPGLPVDLTKFQATKLEPSVVKLEWATASETNNDYIAIEKSSDIENWKEVCRVPSAAPGGNSQHVHDYTCTDYHADEDGQNIVYYRPKQVDLNGTYEYHNTIRVRLQDAAYTTEIQSVYPNPATDRLNIRYDAAENSIFRLKLISLDGKALLQNQYVAKPGVQTLDLDLMEDKLKPGLYVLEIQTEGEVFRQKVYKQ